MIDWDDIVRSHGPAVWRTAHRLLGNRADADECFQETFASALAYVRERPDQPVRNWNALLVRLASARAVDRVRQRHRRSTREVPAADPDVLVDQAANSRPADRPQEAELAARLRSVLVHLPSKQADAFCLHCLEGWTYAEVGEQLGETPNAVGVLVHRARAALRERIALILPREAAITRTLPNDLPRPANSDEVQHER